ncbi:MAG: efflux RND transporter permease subunit [Alphaproteobacteria bacterium]|nr:efflux RND transporter permease subunit [Alphaproteobacteria bacterium]
MNGLIDWAVNHTRTVLTVLVVGVAAGLLSYITIPKEADPDIPIPMIYVALALQGISPEDAERLLVRPMETELKSIEGVKEMTSYARLGGGGVMLEFDVNFDKDKALADVRERVDIARAELPDEAEEPLVKEFNASLFPVIIVTLWGEVPERTLYRLAQDTQDAIEALPGVLEANLAGNREELLEVVIDPSKLESYNVSQEELIRAVTNNNRLVAAGSLDTGQGRFNIKVPGLFETREDVLSLVVKTSGEGVVTLGDIADIRRTFMDATGYARFNGQPAMAIEVKKRVGANIIETTEAVRAVVGALSESWPDTVEVSFTLDSSDWIRNSLQSLHASIMTAISLVMIILVAALGIRSAVLVGIAIPSSFLLAFLFISSLGMTLNMMILFGMVIAVGILVDGAIVMVEYGDRKMAEGLDRAHAYALASKRMFWPIVSSTATTLAAFFPLLFWPGVSGKFMSYLPITVIFVLTASLLVALIFLPVLGSVFGKSSGASSDVARALALDEEGDIRDVKGITGSYARIISRLTQYPLRVLGVVIGTIFLIQFAYSSANLGSEFFVDTEPDSMMIFVGARGNLSADESLALVREVEEIVLDVEGVASVFTSTGGGSDATSRGDGQGEDSPADTIGTMTIQLAKFGTRPPGDEILKEIRDRTGGLVGLHVEVREREQGPPSGKDIQLRLASTNYEALLAETARVRAYLETEFGDVRDIEDTRPLPGIEWELAVDREQAGRFGADISTIGATVQLVTNGILIGKYRPDDADDEVDIRARFPESARGLDQLDALRVQARGELVPISNFVTRRPQQQVSSITRVDGKRIIDVRANVEPGVLPSRKVAELKEWLASAGLHRSVSYSFEGADEEQQESMIFVMQAFAASLFLMALILITQFNNFYHAGLILSSVIMSTMGVLLGMIIMGQTFSVIMSGIGIIALAGIVVNNNIILIDTYQRHIEHGIDPHEAVVRTAAQRLRPIALTTLTTMCGLAPMMFEINIDYLTRTVALGSETSMWWVHLSTAIIFGLGFSTLVILFLTPCLLYAPTLWGPRVKAATDWAGARIRRMMGVKDTARSEGPESGGPAGRQPAE